MKPFRFPVVLLTPLDAAIWLEVDARMDGEREYALHVAARKADRRDAESMYLWEEDRASCCPAWPHPRSRIEDETTTYEHRGPFT